MGWLDKIGSGLVSGAASLIGSGIKAITGKQSSDREYQRQQEFAQNGIRWKVEDAKAAGIHPIFAIGANTPSYSPQAAVGFDFGISEAGQNIARAIEAGQTRSERQEMASIQKRYYEAQIGNVEAQTRQHEAQTDAIKQGIINDALYNNTDFIRQSYLASSDKVRSLGNVPPKPKTTLQPSDVGQIDVKPSEITSPSSRYGSHNAGVGTVMTWKRIGSAIKPVWEPDQGDAITEDLHMSATAKARYAADALKGVVDPPPLSEWPPSEQQMIISGEGYPVFDPIMFEWVVRPRYKLDKYYYNLIRERLINKK